MEIETQCLYAGYSPKNGEPNYSFIAYYASACPEVQFGISAG